MKEILWWLLTALFFTPNVVYSQAYKWESGVIIGAINYTGDVSMPQTLVFSETNLTQGVWARHWINERNSFQFHLPQWRIIW